MLGVPVAVVSTGAVVGGLANAGAGVRGLTQALQSNGGTATAPRLRPEKKYLESGKHGINWKEGAAHAKNKIESQGQWGSVTDLEYAGEKAATLKPGEGDWFGLPSDHSSFVHRPDGTTVRASRFWVRNNGTGTFHGYPVE